MPRPRPTQSSSRPRVAGYARNSSDGQARDETHEIQIDWLRAQAEARGWDLQIYVDAGISGETIEARPAMQRLLASVRAGEVDIVACKAIDRLCRSQKLSAWDAIIETCADAGVRIFAGTEYDLRDPTHRLMLTTLGPGIAGFERAMIRARTEAGRQRAMRDGRKPSGTDPHGLRWSRDARAWTIVEAEAACVRRAFELAAGGTSQRRIAEQLEREGLRGPHGRVSRAWLWRVLRGRTYRGEWTCQGQAFRVPELVSEDLWQRAQDGLGERRKRGRAGKALLAGFGHCAACGLRVAAASVGRASTPYYVCGSAHRYWQERGHPRCGASWRRRQLDDAVWALVVRLLESGGADARAVRPSRRDEAGEARAAVERAEAAVRAVTARVEHLTLRWGRGALGDDAYDRALATLQGERRRVEASAADARRALAALEVRSHGQEQARLTIAQAAGGATTEQRRRILGAICPRPGVDGIWLRGAELELRGIMPGVGSVTLALDEAGIVPRRRRRTE